MRVRMKVDVSGSRDGQDWPPRGGVIEVPEQEGAELCRSGMAEPVAEPLREERAVAPEPEVRESTPKKRGRPPKPRDPVTGEIVRD